MKQLKLTQEEMRYISLFERMTGAVARDCLVDEDAGKVVFVVKNGDMGKAIGKGGANINRLKRSVQKDVEVVEYSDVAEEFVANAFQPAAVDDVEITRDDGKVALVEVVEDDKGLAIGKDGRNIRKVKTLARRHYDIDDVILA